MDMQQYPWAVVLHQAKKKKNMEGNLTTKYIAYVFLSHFYFKLNEIIDMKICLNI